jgi:hypothetical protein
VKSLLLAAAAVMIVTSAHAGVIEDKSSTAPPTETIYITPGSVKHLLTKGPFKTAISGNDKLLVVQPGVSNQDLIVVVNQPPDGTLTASTDVVLMDDVEEVQHLHVIVTPFGGPSTNVRILRPDGATTYLCGNNECIDTSTASRNKGMGAADTETRHKESTPPTPPAS